MPDAPDRPDVPEQLRRYGEAVERLALDAGFEADRRSSSWPSPRPALAFAAVAAVILVVLGVVFLRVTGDDRGTTDVIAVGPLVDTPSSVPPPGTGPPTSTDRVVRGHAAWVGGPDDRGELRVGACPADEQGQACPGWQSALVADDGAFELVLPASVSARGWDVAAYVTVAAEDCVFRCAWQGAVVGSVSTVDASSPPPNLRLSVDARVLELVVRDRDGRPFAGGGVLLRDVACSAPPCGPELVSMFQKASATDGRVRIVVDPDRTYAVHAQALDAGWSDPHITSDGHEYWVSSEFTSKGRALPDGEVLRVDGAPA
jgi:hypothetical protein